MEEFIENIKVLINALGYKVLEPLKKTRLERNNEGSNFILNIGNNYAQGFITSEGFVVLKGARINPKIASSLTQKLKDQRNDLVEKGIIKDYKTQEDILFNSSSSAAAFILGYSVSGPNTWKNREGKSLKEIENDST